MLFDKHKRPNCGMRLMPAPCSVFRELFKQQTRRKAGFVVWRNITDRVATTYKPGLQP
jgi:hypothetical protein